jgi:hypothetical protein
MAHESFSEAEEPVSTMKKKKARGIALGMQLKAVADLASIELGLAGNGARFECPSARQPALVPGCGDLQVAQITRLGFRGKWPESQEWEALLAMLEPGHELLWVVVKRPRVGLRYYLALKTDPRLSTEWADVRESRAFFKSLVKQFSKRAFPESCAEECCEGEVAELVSDICGKANEEVVVTSGLPSPAALEDEQEFATAEHKTSPDASLNDILEPFVDEDNFAIVFTVSRASGETTTAHISALAEIRTAISPLLRRQHTESRSKSTSSARAAQHTRSRTLGQTETPSALPRLFQNLFGSHATQVPKKGSRPVDSSAKGRWKGVLWHGADICGTFGRSLARVPVLKQLGEAVAPDAGVVSEGLARAPVSQQVSKSSSDTYTVSVSDQQGDSETSTTTDAMLELLDQKLQENLRSLKKATGTGAFFLAAEVFSERLELSLRIARAISGTLSGSRTHVRPFQTMVYSGEGFADHLVQACTLQEAYPALALQSRHIAAAFLPVPEADLPGLRTKRNVFYGQPNPNYADDVERNQDTVLLGDLAHVASGFAPIPREQPAGARQNAAFRIPAVDLTSHLLIAGTTGSGKTQRAVSLLNGLDRERFQIIVIESAKKTYQGLLRRRDTPTKILSLGGRHGQALRVNPFFFEPGTSLKRHISVFADALADLLPVEALIGPKIREAIQRAYVRYGWDIETGRYRAAGSPRYPTMADLHMEVLSVAESLQYGPELASNYRGALLGRSRLFIDELYQDIFGWGGSQSLTEVFGESDVIIEMDDLPPSEAKVPAFVLSLLLERMRGWQRAKCTSCASGEERFLVLVIEEAHNLLDKGLEVARSSDQMGSGGFLLKQIVRLLQEGREAGIGVIVVDQSPASLADAVIRNTNTKMILRLTDSDEADRIGATLGLSREECRDLHELEDGEAVVKVKNAGKALKLRPGVITPPQRSPLPPETCSPDYFVAAEVFESLGSLAPEKRGASTVRRVRDLCRQLAAAAGNDDAYRFFCQKLVALICEKRGRPTGLLLRDSLPAPELTLVVCALHRIPEVMQLSERLFRLLAQEDQHDDVVGAMPRDIGFLAEVVGECLNCDPHWAAMDAGQEFQSHLVDLAMATDSESRDQHTSLLWMLANASKERFERIRYLLALMTA